MRCLSPSGLRWAKKTGIFILGTLKLMTVDFSANNLVISIIMNIIIFCIYVVLPYPCMPIYKFCKNLPRALITKPKYFLFQLLCICAEIFQVILGIFGWSSMVEYYQTTMFVIGSMLGRSMNMIALSLVGLGVAYISNESQKVFIFMFDIHKSYF